MAQDMNGLVAVVTGAGRGIGRACALQLARAGAHVIAIARTQSDLDTLSGEAGVPVETWAADVQARETVARIRALPRLDVLVNNAGTNKLQHVFDVDDDTLDMLLALNIRSAFKIAQAGAQAMADAGAGGSIINISSQMGHVGAPKRAVYCMTKHAIEGLTKSMAVELAEKRIRVNTVAPTVVETSMTAPFFKDPAYREAAMAMIPMKMIAQPDDVAAAVVYLASPSARLVSGTSIRVDGAATAM